ncbi:methyltransferase domain-containing protein [Desulfovibrio desulfuricans]|uniref:Methyltransferase domain-containing protein n=1 Tax=Desulfovibrio desulfuricans TaxID=876 RepID=A0A4P7UI41_DESDE|nr:methyltransferase domain-containing protein [Desulfovibrio desulfuricans]QCC84308.1 methyltransferase domain-containing protein [Desulfovibrio desulfuricans]
MDTQATIHKARALFPRGLQQPQGSLRFGADALLLAAFAARQVEGLSPARRNALAAAELGCGCGAALLGLALRCDTLKGLGLDREAPLVQAATANAQLLGLADRLHFAQADLADLRQLGRLPEPAGGKPASFDLVLANPPYDVAGRPSPSRMRERALRAAQGESARKNTGADAPEVSLTVFCRAAANLLRHLGYFCCIYDAAALPRLCAALDDAGLGLRGIVPVRAYASRPAMRVLALARKNAAHQCVLEAPLTLHSAQTATDGAHWSARALRFCPWLA